MNLQTKVLTKDDIEEITQIILDAQNFGEPFLENEINRFEALAESKIGGNLAAIDPEIGILGYLTYEIRFKSIHIITMMTHHKYLRKGIGTFLISELVNKIEADFPGIQVLRVDTGDFMKYAQKFYLSCGFQISGYVSHDFSWSNHQVHFAMRVNHEKN